MKVFSHIEGVEQAGSRTFLIEDSDPVTKDFYFPRSPEPLTNGNVTFEITFTKSVGTDLDNFTVAAHEIFDRDGGDVVATTAFQTLFDDATIVATTVYSKPINTSYGPCKGIRLVIDHANAVDDSDETTVSIVMHCE